MAENIDQREKHEKKKLFLANFFISIITMQAIPLIRLCKNACIVCLSHVFKI